MKLDVTNTMLDIAKDNKAIGVYQMNPQVFLELTTDKPVNQWLQSEQEHTFTVDEYNKFTREGKTIIMPFLDVDIDTGKVLGHEGRHRAAALLAEGEPLMPVAITLKQNRYSIYYREPYGDDLNHPKRFLKQYLSTSDLPLHFVGQFRPYSHTVMLRSFKPFYKDTSLNAVARLQATRPIETADLKDSVKFIQHTAKSFFGECKFDPPNGVTLRSGQVVIYVYPSTNELKPQAMFAKTIRNAALNPRVTEVAIDKTNEGTCLKVVLEKA